MGDYFDILDDLSMALFFVHVVDIVIICNLLDEFVGNFICQWFDKFGRIYGDTTVEKISLVFFARCITLLQLDYALDLTWFEDVLPGHCNVSSYNTYFRYSETYLID